MTILISFFHVLGMILLALVALFYLIICICLWSVSWKNKEPFWVYLLAVIWVFPAGFILYLIACGDVHLVEEQTFNETIQKREL